MTTQSLFLKFDDLLKESDPDSQAWSDGGDSEIASDMLGRFSDLDWELLAASRVSRTQSWRECLANVLSPKQGGIASWLLIDLAHDVEIAVSFAAIRQIAIYCGVNARASGPFIDNRIFDQSFFERAKLDPGLCARITEVGSASAPYFANWFQLLTQVLRGNA